MRTIFDFVNFVNNDSAFIVPLTVFLLSLIVLWGLRKLALDHLTVRIKTVPWLDINILIPSVRTYSALFCLTFSIYLGLLVSRLPDAWKYPLSSGLWTLFSVAIALSSLNLASSLALASGRQLNLPHRTILLVHNILRMSIIIIAVLIVLGLWGAPTSPLLLLIAVLFMTAIFAFRDALPNLFARFQVAARGKIQVGDYVKLESQLEGYIFDIGWSHTQLQALDGSRVIIPNLQLIRQKIINYGHHLKKAKEPFFFKTRPQMAEMTGLKARNLQELVKILKESPETVMYYHTHHFLGEKYFPVAHPSNDFALWVKDALDNPVLAARLSRLNVCGFSNLEILRQKIVTTIEEYLAQEPDGHAVKPGQEFQFVKTANVVMSTDYVARDLGEFIEALRRISPSSLHFHVFESRSYAGNGTNDFSLWLENSLDEPELSREIAGIDPGAYSLEELRSVMVQRIEKSLQ